MVGRAGVAVECCDGDRFVARCTLDCNNERDRDFDRGTLADDRDFDCGTLADRDFDCGTLADDRDFDRSLLDDRNLFSDRNLLDDRDFLLDDRDFVLDDRDVLDDREVGFTIRFAISSSILIPPDCFRSWRKIEWYNESRSKP